MSRIRQRKEKRISTRYYRMMAIRIGILALLLLLVVLFVKKIFFTRDDQKEQETVQDNEFSVNEYPESLLELLEKNPETEEFVLNYPEKKGTYSDEDLPVSDGEEGIPLLIQWDERWGYYEYGGNIMGLAGCGPTSLSMVASYLLNDPSLTPIYMADYSTEHGHSIEGGGTAWSLMTDGARGLGLNPQEVPLDENVIRTHLENGRPIIVNVGEGIFTDNGHYMVFVGWEDDKIKINDPNRREYSERLWDYEEIKDQIKNMWVY